MGPPRAEQVNFLTVCLKHADIKKVDFAAVGAMLDITANAASLRYSRLRKALREGKANTGNMKPDYLFLCMKHSDFKKIDFAGVASEMNCSSNAVSLRWYRMRAMYEKQHDGEVPDTPKKRRRSAKTKGSADGPKTPRRGKKKATPEEVEEPDSPRGKSVDEDADELNSDEYLLSPGTSSRNLADFGAKIDNCFD